MAVQPLSEKTAIAGVGWTEFSRSSGTTPAVLVARASLMAIEDAGLSVDDIDGVVGLFWRDANATISARALARMLGLPALKFDYFHDGGGWWNTAAVLSAATLVHSGLCNNVLVYTGRNGYSEGRGARGRRRLWGAWPGPVHPTIWPLSRCSEVWADCDGQHGQVWRHQPGLRPPRRESAPERHPEQEGHDAEADHRRGSSELALDHLPVSAPG